MPSIVRHFDLSGRRALVTGAASGIGRGTAELLGELGAHVIAADRNADGLAALASERPHPITTFCYEQSDLESYAKDLGLDLAKFKADMTSQGATDRIAADKKLADALGVKGTPSVFINGREFDLRQDIGDWINLELAMMAESGKPTAAVPSSPTGSAAGSAAAKTAPSAGKADSSTGADGSPTGGNAAGKAAKK